MLAAVAPDLAVWEGTVRLVVVAVLAGLVGVERELREHEAGLRTHMLVGVGAALFVMVGNFAWSELVFGNSFGVVIDPSRVVAYVVTGVGFLGAGAIIKHGTSVRGLTTAASLWVVAAVGVAIGAGDYALGVVATALVLASLWPVKRLARIVGLRSQRSHRLDLTVGRDANVAGIVSTIEQTSRIVSVRVDEEHDVRRLEIVVEPNGELAPLVARAIALPDVHEAMVAT